MAHKSQLEFVTLVKENFPAHFSGKKVLEIGSLDINGTIRNIFSDCEYIGIDVAAGPGVDLVCQGQDFAGQDNSFDTVISCEVMEHNPHWAETFRNMVRVCRPGGLVIMTCATLGRGEHGTARTDPNSSPLTVQLGWNYYYNLTARDFIKANLLTQLSHIFAYHWGSHDLYLVGIKGIASKDQEEKLFFIKQHYRNLLRSKFSHFKKAIKSTMWNKRR